MPSDHDDAALAVQGDLMPELAEELAKLRRVESARAAAVSNRGIRVWDLEKDQLVYEENDGGVSLAWADDGRRLAIGSTRGAIVLDVLDGKRTALIEGHAVSHLAWQGSWMAFSDPQSRLLISL